MKSISLATAALALAGYAGASQATIVNISATDSAQNTSQFFAAGTYNINVIDNTANAGGYNGWTYAVPISNQAKPYREAFTFTIGNASTTYDVSTGNSAGYYTGYASISAALAAFSNSATGYAQFTSSNSTFSNSAMQLVLASDATVRFSVPDSQLWDNTGGVSLSITRAAAVPEPGSVAMVFAGLGALAWTSRRRKSV